MGANPRFHRVFNKLQAWELDRNAKVCLLDTDTLIVKNADELLSFPAPTTLIRGQELPGWHHSPKSRRKKVRAPSDYLFASARPLSNDYLPVMIDANPMHAWPLGVSRRLELNGSSLMVC